MTAKFELPPPIVSDVEWQNIATRLVQLGGSYIRTGQMDDIAPDGSPNTACQLNQESAARQGHVITVQKPIADGITQNQTFRIFPPK